MFELISIARPYAKASFEFAVKHQSIDHWQKMLTFAVKVVKNEQISELLVLDSLITPKKLYSLFIDICGDHLDKEGRNFIRVIIENRRLSVLPAILQLYIQQRNLIDNIAEIKIISANVLRDEQIKKIRDIIENRFSCKVRINYKIEKFIMAGFIIQLGDIVIDGSIRNRIERLSESLQF